MCWMFRCKAPNKNVEISIFHPPFALCAFSIIGSKRILISADIALFYITCILVVHSHSVWSEVAGILLIVAVVERIILVGNLGSFE